MSEDEFSNMQKKLLGWLLVVVLGGNTGVILLNKSNPDMRSDPFTGTDAKELKEDLMKYTDNAFALHRLQIPPRCTREKIESIMDWVERQDPTFRSPCRGW